MKKRSRATHRKDHKEKPVKIRFPKSLSPLVVTAAVNLAPRKLESGEPKPADCFFDVTPSTSVQTNGGIVICKYSQPNDANSNDSVTFKGGPTVVDINLAPVFYGSAWLTSVPSANQVMAAIKRVIESPYLSEMVQYGFHSLTVKQPVLKAESNPPASHSANNAGEIVWDLIDDGVFPEPDEAGGANIYIVFYPPGTAVSDVTACGWHNTYYSDFDAFDLDSAWVGAVDFPTGTGKTSVLDNIIKVFTHELIEIISDPVPDDDSDDGWVMDRTINGGLEIGDACNNTADFVNGFLVNAYWSEQHKACIIPKPLGYVDVSVASKTISTEVLASGTSQFDNILCLLGNYKWTLSTERKEITLTANAENFEQPKFFWTLPQQQNGPWTAGDGFSGPIFLIANTWSETVNGASYSKQMVRIDITVNKGTMKIDNSSSQVNFLFKVEVTAAEGAFKAKSFKQIPIKGEIFKYDDAYYKALDNCYDRLHRQLVELRPTIPRSGPAISRWAWEDKLSPWISGERLTLVAEMAAMAAAFEESNPELAHQLRSEAAFYGRAPGQLLMPQQIQRGRISAHEVGSTSSRL